MSLLLTVAIGLVALLYASVGHAGATGYTAVMALCGSDPAVIRPTALALNVLVAAIGTIQFARAGHFRRELFWPLTLASVPCAVAGGAVTIPTAAFEALLAAVLLVAAVRIVLESRTRPGADPDAAPAGGHSAVRPAWLAAVGGGIGLLSGLTGVGGGVFLTPLLLARRAAAVKQVAAVTAPFILANSLAGLAGGLAAGGAVPAVSLPAVAAAALGAAAGSHLGAFRLPVPAVRRLMAAVLAVASLKLCGGLAARVVSP